MKLIRQLEYPTENASLPRHIEENEILVFQFNTPERLDALTDFQRILSPDEVQKLNKYRKEEDRINFLSGRGMARNLLGTLLNIEPYKVEFHYSDYDKPFIAEKQNTTDVQFNVSHSGEIVVIALNTHNQIGVDLEYMTSLEDMDDIARMIFFASERAALANLPPSEKESYFFETWTRHEAELKALGIGLSGAKGILNNAKIESLPLNLPKAYKGSVAISV